MRFRFIKKELIKKLISYKNYSFAIFRCKDIQFFDGKSSASEYFNLIYAVPSIFNILSVGFLLIE